MKMAKSLAHNLKRDPAKEKARLYTSARTEPDESLPALTKPGNSAKTKAKPADTRDAKFQRRIEGCAAGGSKVAPKPRQPPKDALIKQPPPQKPVPSHRVKAKPITVGGTTTKRRVFPSEKHSPGNRNKFRVELAGRDNGSSELKKLITCMPQQITFL